MDASKHFDDIIPDVKTKAVTPKSTIAQRIIKESLSAEKPRKVSHTIHIDASIKREINKLARQANLSESAFTELLLKDALGL